MTAAALLVVFGCALVGYGKVAAAKPANSVPQRAECYEWFVAQLLHASGRSQTRLAELIEEVDRGDPSFRTLRFKVRLALTPTSDPAMLQKEARRRRAMRAVHALFALTHMGRMLAGELTRARRLRPAWMQRDQLWDAIDRLPDVEAAALLHGIGLGCEPPRLKGPAQRLDSFMASFEKLLADVPERHAMAIAEGYGFGIGFVHDPYSRRRAELVAMQASLPPRVLPSLYRGIGWGYRQRYIEPPTTVPDGLTILDSIPAEYHRAFRGAFVGEVVPLEAASLRRAAESRGP